MKLSGAAWLAVLAALVNGPTWAADGLPPDCPVLPQFRTLRQSLEAVSALDGLHLIEQYANDPANENPMSCEWFELDRLMSDRETALVSFAGPGFSLHPQLAYHCDRYDRRTTACNGAFADDTALPHTGGVVFYGVSRRLRGRIEQSIPGWRLQAIYRLSPADLQNGRPPTRVRAPDGRVSISPGDRDDALVALFSAPKPWAWRKLVWYVDTLPLVPPAAAR